jgi:hypothetical protein
MTDHDQFFADRPTNPPTLLGLVARYGALMVAASSPRLDGEVASARAAEAADVFREIGRRRRAAEALTTYTDRATVMDVLDGRS